MYFQAVKLLQVLLSGKPQTVFPGLQMGAVSRVLLGEWVGGLTDSKPR